MRILSIALAALFFSGNLLAENVDCPAGFYVDGGLCVPASPGYFVAEPDAVAQTACPVGTYQPSSGQTECLLAQPGHYVNVTGAAAQSACEIGTYQPNSGSISCFLAPAGRYVDVTGAVVAIPCEPGTYQPNAGSAFCLVAEAGYFVNTSGATEQTVCPSGTTSVAGATECTAELNNPPVALAGGPYLGPVNTAISFDGSGSSDPDDDDLTYAWTFGDDDSGTGPTPSHAYSAVGLYDVCLTVDDGTVDSEKSCTIVAVYDPSAGFVTGGGWIQSPAGAYQPDPDLAGKASFGFVSKYKNGQSTPSGDTQFTFSVAGLSFASAAYDWLIVAGSNAKFKGLGTINDAGDYGFMLTATDGGSKGADLFRIKIWDRANGDALVYDNQDGASEDSDVGTTLGGGQIIVHSKGGGASKSDSDQDEEEVAQAVQAAVPARYMLEANYPNPFNPQTRISFALPEASDVRLTVYDVSGRVVRVLVDGRRDAGLHEVGFDATALPSGTYIYRIAAGSFTQTRHMVLMK